MAEDQTVEPTPVVAPEQTPLPPASPTLPPPAPAQPQAQPQPPAEPEPQPPLEVPQPSPESAPELAPAEDQAISWTGPEFVAHEKNAGWYAMLALIAVTLCCLVYLLTKDAISAVVVIVGALAFGFFAARQAKQIRYAVSNSGIDIGERHFTYTQFRSFTVAPEGPVVSIIFRPLKRFGTLVTIYFAPTEQQKIVELLAGQLPYEEHRPDVIDRLMSHVRF